MLRMMTRSRSSARDVGHTRNDGTSGDIVGNPNARDPRYVNGIQPARRLETGGPSRLRTPMRDITNEPEIVTIPPPMNYGYTTTSKCYSTGRNGVRN